MSSHVRVEIGAGDVVSIALPAFMVKVCRADAAILRDRLNSVLPEQITDLMHDPRIIDLEVLRAAQALLAERGQDTESLAVAIDHLEASRNPKRCTLCRCDATDEVHGFPVCGYHVDHTEDDAPCPQCNPPKLHLLSIAGDVEPELSGRYDNERERTEAAQDYRRAHGDEDGLFRLDIAADGSVTVDTFTGAELDPARLQVAVGDRVRDPLDGGRWREIVRIDLEGTCHMRDGGCMSVAECAAAEKRLPGESLPCPACEAWADGGRILSEEQWTAAVDALCAPCGVAGRMRGMHA